MTSRTMAAFACGALLAGCAGAPIATSPADPHSAGREAVVAAPATAEAPGTSEALALQDPAPAVDFASQVRPILEAKCTPCHFPGGKMYDRMPFDKPETIRFLGTDLFTRLKDEGDQAIISGFLRQPPGQGEAARP